ncbi:unnamed protein product [Anisakis simplex]|uniref:Putative hydroxypyruvate isomerase (inferred by orthology to a C. elegans protein) n=1 Tax=Anisakis simplex TaxID=6269 RepID=A0A0M3KB85_ANISI|nr:unnamed protein product [Anisakis simplex]
MAGLAEVNDETRRTYVENIRYASQLFAKNDIICLIEPINEISIPGYFLHSYQQALEIIKEINESNLKLMFDVFHAQQICGQLTKSIVDLKSFIGHVQIAQVPERHEPDSAGEINYEYIFKILKENGDWDIGCEYMERGESMEYFEWMKRYELI